MDKSYSSSSFSSFPSHRLHCALGQSRRRPRRCHPRWEPLKEGQKWGWVGGWEFALCQTLGWINKPGNIKRPFPLHLWTYALDCVNIHRDVEPQSCSDTDCSAAHDCRSSDLCSACVGVNVVRMNRLETICRIPEKIYWSVFFPKNEKKSTTLLNN